MWPVISYSPPGPPPPSATATVVLARTSEPPCFSVIAMPQSEPLLPAAGAELLIVVQREQARLPFLGELGLGAQRRDRREGHRDRAADPALGRHQLHEHRGPRDVGTPTGLSPGQRVQPEADANPHQFVPGAVEFDLIDAIAVAIVCTQDRLALVGLKAQADRLSRAADLSQLAGALLGPPAPLAAQRLDQGTVRIKGVVVLQRGRLVENLVGARGPALDCCHRLDCVTFDHRRRTAIAAASALPGR